MDNGNIVVLVQFDISKAFDTINHELLLSKLRKTGFSNNATTLIWSYISNRSHSVLNQDGHPSPPIYTTSGIPQGSSLSGNLFNIFIDMLIEALDVCSDSYSIFADDTNIWLSYHPKQLKNCIILLNEECNRISNQIDKLGLKLNPDKSIAIIFGSPHNLSNLCIANTILIKNIAIPFSDKVKILGVTLSNDLSWNCHISNLSRNINFTLHRLYRMGSYLNIKIKLLLIKSLILPLFDYCCNVYYDLSGYLSKKLDKLLNRAIRYIYNLPKHSHITPFKLRANLLSLSSRRKFFLISLFFKIINTKTPLYLLNNFPTTESLNPIISIRRSKRSNIRSSNFIIPLSKTPYMLNSFRANALREWNLYPPCLRHYSSLFTFNNTLFNYIKFLDRTN